MATQTTTGPDPAADVRDRVAAHSGVPELAEKLWFHKTAAAVIDAGRCVGCGGCIAACPSRSISVDEDGHPTLTRMCTGCSACWDFCPLAGLRTERLAREGSADELGTVLAAWSAHATSPAEGAQDGGVVTALLAALLEAGTIDAALVTRRVDAFRGETVLATTPEQIRAAAGSSYHQGHPLAALAQPLPSDVKRVALVGTPCQVSVLRALQRFPWPRRRGSEAAVALTVALFCTRSFQPLALAGALAAEGLDVRRVARLAVRDGELVAFDAQGSELLRRPVRALRSVSLRGCEECADFAGLTADLAVGSLASEPGHSTVLVRTAAGAQAWSTAAAALDARPLEDLSPLARAAARNRRRAEPALARGFDPAGPLWVGYPEHLAAYQGTERAPSSPPPHRSHHYEVSC
ncbi:MAG TPA: Coenzyme F420 hydrogenase/dehydrogenase, beta subunit C-terminal domain [Actinomycetota bacterium]|jgi:coenzyme F420 hydrogenase subunit beta|nr:Coenzyme F420 hydrogenase/dehydrogenase, beta subunit C-terminal domain [Actinomycetota bacterium]